MMRDALVNLRFKLLTARMTPRKRPMKEKAAVSIEFHSNSMYFHVILEMAGRSTQL